VSHAESVKSLIFLCSDFESITFISSASFYHRDYKAANFILKYQTCFLVQDGSRGPGQDSNHVSQMCYHCADLVFRHTITISTSHRAGVGSN
jgi:hypothetical protein